MRANGQSPAVPRACDVREEAGVRPWGYHRLGNQGLHVRAGQAEARLWMLAEAGDYEPLVVLVGEIKNPPVMETRGASSQEWQALSAR
jgi:hypothetical protein